MKDNSFDYTDDTEEDTPAIATGIFMRHDIVNVSALSTTYALVNHN